MHLKSLQGQFFGRLGPAEAYLGLDPDFKEVGGWPTARGRQRPIAVAGGTLGVACLKIITGQLAL